MQTKPITLARRHGKTEFEILVGPDVPLHTHRANLQKLLLEKTNEDFSEITFGWVHIDKTLNRETKAEAKKLADAEAKRIARETAIFEAAQKERAELARIAKLPKLEREAALKALNDSKAKKGKQQ